MPACPSSRPVGSFPAFPALPGLPGVWLALCAFLALLIGSRPAFAITLADALDQPGLTLNTSGDAAWFAQTAITADGVDAAQSGVMGDSRSSTLTATFAGKATVSFRWKVSSEECCDALYFYIDGVEQADSIRGDVDWQEKTYQVEGSGVHTLTWTYSKDSSVSTGYDAAWLDKLSIETDEATARPAISGVDTSPIGAGESAALKVRATGGALSFQWYRGDRGDISRPVTGATGPVLLTPPLPEDASFWVRVSNSRGTADSPATIVRASPAVGYDLYAMGSSYYGQLGIGVSRGAPVRILASEVAQAVAGTNHSLLIKSDGTLWAVGANDQGQLGDGTTQNRSIPVLVSSDVVQAAAGYQHSLFIKVDGTLWAMGNNSYGQLGVVSLAARSAPVQIATDVAHVAAGGFHSLFVKTDGSLWVMGQGSSGQLGYGYSDRFTPLQVASDVASVAAGGLHSLFVKTDHTLWTMGGNSTGQLGNGTFSYGGAPSQVATDVAFAAAGHSHSFFVKTDGTLWAMGSNYTGQLGDGTYYTNRPVPLQVASDVTQVVAGSLHSLFLKTDGSLWGMGSNEYSQLGRPPGFTLPAPFEIATGVTHIAANGLHSLLVRTDGSLWGMGYNGSNQLSEVFGASTTERTTPAAVAGDITRIVAGPWHSLFVKADGTLWAMGRNESGQLGDGSLADRSSPVQIATDVVSVACGEKHSLFIKSDRSLWAVGENGSGAIGDGTTNRRATPVQVATEVAQVAAGAYFSLFIKTDGSLWGMGSNYSGQLGGAPYYQPAPLFLANGVVQIAAGAEHALFLKADGSLWGMGSNSSGQLGNGTSYNSSTPVFIASDIACIAAGSGHSLFIKTDGSLWATGANYSGQLGIGYSSNVYAPVQVASDVTGVAAGSAHTLFIKTDTSLWSVGNNESGQLGDGTLGNWNNRSVPVQIATGAAAVAAGGQQSFFLQGLTHTVTFDLGEMGVANGGGALEQTVIEGRPARAPRVSVGDPAWALQGWDADFSHITGDLLVHAVYRRRQTISFAPPVPGRFDPAGLNAVILSATADSGLPVTFEVLSGPASLDADGVTLRLDDAGIFIVRATQAGDDTWSAADPVEHRFLVRGLGQAQKITFPPPAPRTYGDPAFALEASASSGLPVLFELVSGPATLADGRLTVTGVGRVLIKASQPGGDGFGAASDVTRALIVNKAPLVVTVLDVTRFVGQDNPEFVLSYSGFVGAEAANVAAAIAALDRPPIARCKAGRRSPQGAYPITTSGGSDDLYEFISPNPSGSLMVQGFGGTYEALLLDGDSNPVGKLTLTIPANALSYTGVLSLAREARPLVVSSTSRIEGTTLFLLDEATATASATWNHAVTGFDSLSLTVGLDGTLAGSFSRNLQLVGSLNYGRRLYVPVTGTASPWSGQHTLALLPGSPVYDNPQAYPLGSGHAAVSIAPASGILKLSGKLADGVPFTASLKPTGIGTYLLWTNPYGARTYSFLSGLLADDSVDPNSTEPVSISDTPSGTSGSTSGSLDITGSNASFSFINSGGSLSLGSVSVGSASSFSSASLDVESSFATSHQSGSAMTAEWAETSGRPRFTRRDAIRSIGRFLTWQKAALPENIPATKRDKTYRAGFGPLVLPATLDPWLPPLTKATADQPVVTLPQRLGLASTNVASGEIAIIYPQLDGNGAYPLPAAATLTPGDRLLVGTPNPTGWKITALNPATGTFSGRFVLTDPTPTENNPDKTTRRTVSFSGIFRQRPYDDSMIGTGFFLLPALPGAEYNEPVSGEIRFIVP